MASSYDTVILAESSLTAYYTLNADGTDSVGAFNGTVTGGSFSNVGGCTDGSKCWTTTGSGTEQIVATGDPLPSSGDFAIEFAMKATAAGGAELIWVAPIGSNLDGVYLRNSNEIDARSSGNPTGSGPNLSDTIWHLYQVSYKSSTTEIKWYKDGILATTTTTAMSTGARATSGLARLTNGINMQVQKCSLYNAQLSQSQVTAHYHAYSTVPGGPFTQNVSGNLEAGVTGGMVS
jgi:hypothetical protein